VPAIKRLGNAPHLAWHGKIANAHFTQMIIHIAAEQVENVLAKRADGYGLGGDPVEEERQVQNDHIETSIDRVRDAVNGIKRRMACLRHDRAIEGSDVPFAPFAGKEKEFHSLA